MTALAPNTVSKLFYFDNRIKSIFEKYGHTAIPFDGTKVQAMIHKAQKELVALFYKIWGSSMGYHLLNKFYDFRGNIYEFFMSLDNKNRELLTGKDW
ncbi:hypothetical protein [Carboxylicivirga caseinilyticus]|uniref:hypothetical protein n=1 Tax=Carboxylicivirga caseinilyticus TaxID=3417572 RepID=UPI003D33C44E|nr:hypothetical protein [Marinilabiliaceae bacterium A049]